MRGSTPTPTFTTTTSCEPWGESSYQNADGSTTNEVTHLVLDGARALTEPIPCSGALGLWRPDDDALDEVRTQLPDLPL